MQWRHNGLDVRGPSAAEIARAEEEWTQASCDYSPHRGLFAAADEEEEEDGPGIGGAIDDEVEGDGEMVEAIEEVLAERDRLEGESEGRAGSEERAQRVELTTRLGGLESAGLNAISEEEGLEGMPGEGEEGWYTE